MINNSSSKCFDSIQRLRPGRNIDLNDPNADPERIRAKVLEDISFLQSRIDHIKRVKASFANPAILNTYQSMLESREEMLSLLDDTLPNFERQSVIAIR